MGCLRLLESVGVRVLPIFCAVRHSHGNLEGSGVLYILGGYIL